MSSLALYAELADTYAKAIELGTIKPDARLPSVRELARIHSISVSTAMQVYRTLEMAGLVQARPRSGYFVSVPSTLSLKNSEHRVRGLPNSAHYIGIHTEVSNFVALRESGSFKYDLSQACATPDLYPTQALRTHLMRAIRLQPQVFSEAPPLKGDLELRAALAEHALKSGIVIDSEQILITSGATEAINLALKAVATEGDVVAVESPAFYGIFQVLESLGLKALEIPTHPHTGFSVDALELALNMGVKVKAVVVVPLLQNPQGCNMPDESKQRLLKLCEKHHVALIEDDPYRDFLDPNPALKSIKSYDKNGQVIYCASLHKILAPGLRLGWISAGQWQARVEMLKYAQSHNTDGLSQTVAARFLSTHDYERHSVRFRAALKSRMTETLKIIDRYFPKNITINKPLGGMQLWVELEEGSSSRQIYNQAAEQGLLITPGYLFSNSDKSDNCFRINTSGICSSEKEDVMKMLGDIVKKETLR